MRSIAFPKTATATELRGSGYASSSAKYSKKTVAKDPPGRLSVGLIAESGSVPGSGKGE